MLDAAPNDVSLRHGDDVRHTISSVDHRACQRALAHLHRSSPREHRLAHALQAFLHRCLHRTLHVSYPHPPPPQNPSPTLSTLSGPDVSRGRAALHAIHDTIDMWIGILTIPRLSQNVPSLDKSPLDVLGTTDTHKKRLCRPSCSLANPHKLASTCSQRHGRHRVSGPRRSSFEHGNDP